MKRIAYFMLPLFLAGVLFSVIKIISIEQTLHSADDNYSYLAELASGSQDRKQIQSEEKTAPDQENSIKAPSSESVPQTEIDFGSLQRYNPDIIAWIRIPNSNINYPVLHGPDNQKYLRHTPDGEYNIAGSIFMEYTNASDFSDNHIIIYGHHFRGSYRPMFTQLVDYKSEAFFKAHPVAQLFTPAGTYTIRIFSCYVTKLGSGAWRTQMEGDVFSHWIENVISQAAYNTKIIPSETDRIITLSTCSTEFENARFVVHGILELNKNDT